MPKKRLIVLDHPLIQHKLTMLRDRTTNSRDFRDLLDEISTLMAYEVTRHLPTQARTVTTPLMRARGKMIPGKMLGVVVILRAGLGMVDGILKLVPGAKVGHIGLYRDPQTMRPIEYFCKFPPDVPKRFMILVDPMLATGYSASAALDILKRAGARKVSLMCLLSCPEGLRVVQRRHPDVPIFTCAVDKKLNSHGYILPGLGDAGDRLFGTR
ncbi:MAG TPA: uracil phosphoribosyltransferase [Elusimicrobiota bacterium]|nr:uracil phosphoribosyltransferase [Elusimicrobiota bacterium]